MKKCLNKLRENSGLAPIVPVLVLFVLISIGIFVIAKIGAIGAKQGQEILAVEEKYTLRQTIQEGIDCCKTLGVTPATILPLTCTNDDHLLKDSEDKPLTSNERTIGSWSVEAKCGKEATHDQRIAMNANAIKIAGNSVRMTASQSLEWMPKPSFIELTDCSSGCSTYSEARIEIDFKVSYTGTYNVGAEIDSGTPGGVSARVGSTEKLLNASATVPFHNLSFEASSSADSPSTVSLGPLQLTEGWNTIQIIGHTPGTKLTRIFLSAKRISEGLLIGARRTLNSSDPMDDLFDGEREFCGKCFKSNSQAECCGTAPPPPTGNWFPAPGQDCETFCPTIGRVNTPSPDGNEKCTSGEITPPSALAQGNIVYQYDCWYGYPGPCNKPNTWWVNAVSENNRCFGVRYDDGRTQPHDNDVTDITMGCHCT